MKETTIEGIFLKPTWHMKIGSLQITHVEPLSLWQRIGLRFLGWKVWREGE